MSMQPGDEPIVGGTVLRIPAIQSPNYSPGTSGWIIRQDGSVEFSAGVFRASVEVGTDPGAHILLDSTTNAILMYDSGNNLIASITPTSQTIGGIAVLSGIESLDPAHPLNHVRLTGGQIQLQDTTNAPTASPGLVSPNNQSAAGGIAQLLLNSGSIGGSAAQQAQLQLVSESGSGALSAWIQATQQPAGPGTLVSGQVVQSSGAASSEPFMVHVAAYSLTTNGSGQATFAHGANFTPVQAVFGGGGNNTIAVMVWGKSYGATNATVQVNTASGTPFVGNVQIVGVFWGT